MIIPERTYTYSVEKSLLQTAACWGRTLSEGISCESWGNVNAHLGRVVKGLAERSPTTNRDQKSPDCISGENHRTTLFRKNPKMRLLSFKRNRSPVTGPLSGDLIPFSMLCLFVCVSVLVCLRQCFTLAKAGPELAAILLKRWDYEHEVPCFTKTFSFSLCSCVSLCPEGSWDQDGCSGVERQG